MKTIPQVRLLMVLGSLVIAIGTLGAENELPVLDISSPSVTEGQFINWVVSIDEAQSKDIELEFVVVKDQRDYATYYESRNIAQPQDYTGKVGSTKHYRRNVRQGFDRLTFPAGETSRTVTVKTVADGIYENTEYLVLTIYNRNNGNVVQFADRGKVYADCPFGFCASSGDATGCCGCAKITDVDPRPKVSLRSTKTTEGNNLEFITFLDRKTEVEFDVEYYTIEGSATPTVDYATFRSNLRFGRGISRQIISLPTIDDKEMENPETVKLRMTTEERWFLGRNYGLQEPLTVEGTILDNDEEVTATLHPTTAHEGDGVIEFRAILDEVTDNDLSLSYRTKTHTAHDITDYNSGVGSAVFEAGSRITTIRIDLVDDDIVESTERFFLETTGHTEEVTSGSGTTYLRIAENSDTVSGDIVDDDTMNVSVNDASPVKEGTDAVFSLSLSQPAPWRMSVGYSTEDGTATQPDDYVRVAGEAVFEPGEYETTVAVSTVHDTMDESNENFQLQLNTTNDDRLSVGRSTANALILDDDLPPPDVPIIYVDGQTVTEGETLVFQLDLDRPTRIDTSVMYSTGGITATSGLDYQPERGTVVFPAGTTRKTVEVETIDDLVDESQESLRLSLSTPTGLSLGEDSALGYIEDNDEPPPGPVEPPPEPIEVIPDPEWMLTGASAFESDGRIVFSLVDTEEVGYPDGMDLEYELIRDDSGVLQGSFNGGKTGTLSLMEGQSEAVIEFAVENDFFADEPDEHVTLEIVLPDGTVKRSQGIVMDDDTVSISSSDSEYIESSGYSWFEIAFDNPSVIERTVEYSTSDMDAKAPEDYVAVSGVLTFAPRTEMARIRVPLTDDRIVEQTEYFMFSLALNDGNNVDVKGQITDDDFFPNATVEGSVGKEDMGELMFTVRLSSGYSLPVIVGYETREKSAEEGKDYGSVVGTVTFAPEETEALIPVAIVNDNIPEYDEEFEMRLLSHENATPGISVATGTILDDDVPNIAINDDTVSEEGGPLVFEVTLDVETPRYISMRYHTEDMNATGGQDYLASEGSLTFMPGETSHVIEIPVIDDLVEEPDEDLRVMLSKMGAQDDFEFHDPEGIGTILDNDEPPVLVSSIPSILLCVGGDSHVFDLREHFTGLNLSFAVESSKENVSVILDGSVVTVTPVSKGNTVLTVEATNAVGPVSSSIDVSVVEDQAEIEAIQSALASIAVNEMEDAVSAVERRFADADVSAREAPVREAVRWGHVSGDAFLETSFDRYGLWARVGERRFDGGTNHSSHDGKHSSIRVGADMRLGNWLTGLAFGKSKARVQYMYEPTIAICRPGSGSMDADWTSLQPYMGRVGEGRNIFYGSVGLGNGELMLDRCDESLPETLDLSMNVAFVGGRHALNPDDSWTWSVVEDASYVKATAKGTYRDLSVSASRVRAGMEISNGLLHARISTRGDSGDGPSGFGIEGAAGFRIVSCDWELEAELQALGLHTEDSYSEYGGRVRLVINPNDVHNLTLMYNNRFDAFGTDMDSLSGFNDFGHEYVAEYARPWLGVELYLFADRNGGGIGVRSR